MSTPRCSLSCPECGALLPAGVFYGPCAACRQGLRDRAAEVAADRTPPEPVPAPEPVPPPARPPQMHAASEIVGHCEHCTKPVYGTAADQPQAAHPCCAFWVGLIGFDRCYACNPPTGRIPATPPAPSQPPRTGRDEGRVA